MGRGCVTHRCFLFLCLCSSKTTGCPILRGASASVEGIKSLPESIRQLTSLKKLGIVDCEGFKSLPESIRQLTNLKELRISGCPELKRWCETKENKKTLVHIQKKDIWQ